MGMTEKIKFFPLYFSLGQVGGYVVPFLEGCCKTCKWLMTLPTSQVCLICCYLRNKVDFFSCMKAWFTDLKGCAFPSFTDLNTSETSGVKSEESSLTLKGLFHW